jgi:aconitate hydratase 2/2-methylisocitrate dehydratase
VQEPVIEYLNSNITMLKWMIAEGTHAHTHTAWWPPTVHAAPPTSPPLTRAALALARAGYGDRRTIERRIGRMEEWLAKPVLMEADKGATYAETIVINMDTITEPILCAPNDPDDARKLSDVMGDKVDEVFIGSCMTNIGHFRAAGKLLAKHDGQLPTKLWVAPPTKMDAAQLTAEGYYSTYGKVGARTEMPGCSLCMGNQARVNDKATVVSTSTRNFPNRLGKGANVYLASAELAAIAAILGRLPTPAEYQAHFHELDATAADTYRYLNFDKVPTFVDKASKVAMSDEIRAEAKKLQDQMAK